MARKLKVYRTPIGFHDAYVAAPSQKAALKAWGSDADFFARGIAEPVTDEALMREPLANPGTVIRKPRGTNADYLAALPKDRPRSKKRAQEQDALDATPLSRRSSRPAGNAKPASVGRPAAEAKEPPAGAKPAQKASRPKPRPSRAKLDRAEQKLERAHAMHETAIAEIRDKEMRLQQQRRALERQHESDVAKLEAAVQSAREARRAASRSGAPPAPLKSGRLETISKRGK